MTTDIQLTSDGDIAIASTAVLLHSTTEEYIRQKVQIALRLIQGEWFLNVNAGVPYLGSPFTDKANKPAVDNYLKKYILDIEGVKSLGSFESTINSARRYSLDFSVVIESGEIIGISDLGLI